MSARPSTLLLFLATFTAPTLLAHPLPHTPPASSDLSALASNLGPVILSNRALSPPAPGTSPNLVGRLARRQVTIDNSVDTDLDFELEEFKYSKSGKGGGGDVPYFPHHHNNHKHHKKDVSAKPRAYARRALTDLVRMPADTLNRAQGEAKQQAAAQAQRAQQSRPQLVHDDAPPPFRPAGSGDDAQAQQAGGSQPINIKNNVDTDLNIEQEQYRHDRLGHLSRKRFLFSTLH